MCPNTKSVLDINEWFDYQCVWYGHKLMPFYLFTKDGKEKKSTALLHSS